MIRKWLRNFAYILAIPFILQLTNTCTIKLTHSGEDTVTTVTESQKECCCELIDVVIASGLNHGTSSDKMASALQAVRNEVAELGGNAMYIISIDHGDAITIVAEALRCFF